MADLLGRLYVEITADTKQYDKSIGKTKKNTKEISKDLSDFSKRATLAFAGVAIASLKFASDAEETRAKFNTAFKGIEDQANQTAQSLSENYGLAISTSERLLSGTGDLLKGFGATADQALDTSLQVQQLSVDLASYNNLQGGASRASEIITKAFLGERDALVSLGIKISEADVQQKLLLKGQEDLTGQALLLAKGQATLDLVYQQSGDALGDYERTSESAANQSKLLIERSKELAEGFGNLLLPIATDLLSGVNNLFKGFNELDDSTKKIAVALIGVNAVLPAAITGVKALGLAFSGAGGPITLIATAITGIIAGLTVLKEQKLKELEQQFGSLSEEIGKSSEELDEIRKQFVVYSSQTEKTFTQEQKNLQKVQEEYGLTRQQLIKILATSELYDEQQKVRFQNEAEGYRRIEELQKQKELSLKEEAELQRLQAEAEKQRIAELEAAEKIRLENEKVLLEQTLLEKADLEQEFTDKLLMQSENRFLILEEQKEADILRAQELGASIVEIELFYANEERALQEQLRMEEFARQEEITAKQKEENQKRVQAISSSIGQITNIVNGLQQIQLNNIENRFNKQREALQAQGLNEEDLKNKIDKLNKEQALEEWKVEKELFAARKTAANAQAIINVAQGVTAALASAPPPFNAALAGITAVAGAVQLGVINSEPSPARPAFAQGGVAAGATNALVGEAGGEVMIGMGAQGAPLLNELVNRISDGLSGRGAGVTNNYYSSIFSPVNDSDMRKFTRMQRPFRVEEDQRIGTR